MNYCDIVLGFFVQTSCSIVRNTLASYIYNDLDQNTVHFWGILLTYISAPPKFCCNFIVLSILLHVLSY